MQSKQLSRADSRVLAQVFDPESAPDRAEVLVDGSLPEDRHIDAALLLRLKGREREAVSIIEQFEKAGHRGSKDDAYRSALRIMDDLVAVYPNYASARNNRAQLRRWRYGDRHALCQRAEDPLSASNTVGSDAVQDLKVAISLASPARPQDAVSPAQGRLLAQSYTQLAAIYYAAFKDLDVAEIMQSTSPDFLNWDKGRFEDEASKLFYLGGLYGNEVAKALAVHTNPHAKLCGSIVREAMRKELASVS